MHHSGIVSDQKDKKPEMILDYNKTKGAVDNLDKLVAEYTCRRQTKRWPITVFYNIIDVSAYNAFVLWLEINPTWHKMKLTKRRIFWKNLECLWLNLF